MTINYRNPQEVSELASDFAEEEGLYISTVNAVRTIPDSVRRNMVTTVVLDGDAASAGRAASPQFVSADGTGRVAVIAPTICSDARMPCAQSGFQRFRVPWDSKTEGSSEQPEWDEQISVCSTETVKGLEFDAVVVVQPGRIEEDAPSRLVAASDLYVAMTRPTQRLVIVRTKRRKALQAIR